MTGRVRATAPVRVCDAGGWTDTWFAGHGSVTNLAVSEGTEVSVDLTSPCLDGEAMVDLSVRSFGERYSFPLNSGPNRHPLIEKALTRWCPPGFSAKVEIASSVPPGSGLGTSASVVVALVAALRAAAGDSIGADDLAPAFLPADFLAADFLAAEAHRIETEDVGLQSGVQDQIAAAHGGANLILVGPYPAAEVRPLEVSDETWESLGRRLVTVYLGVPHRSSFVHEAVIARLAHAGGDALLGPLRSAAIRAADALVAGELDEYGKAMTANTEAQASLDPRLVGDRARVIIELASSLGAAGWKVNGAGGDGGSVTIVCPENPGRLLAALDTLRDVTRLKLAPSREGVLVERLPG